MTGGLLQLVSYGAQDLYLTGNPQITFFKGVYRRHTHFAMESIENVFNGNADFGKKVTCTIARNGDLIQRIFVNVQLPDVMVPIGKSFRWLDYIGLLLLKTVEIEIGGSRIDKHYSEWLHVWSQLTQKSYKTQAFNTMVGQTPELIGVTVGAAAITAVAASGGTPAIAAYAGGTVVPGKELWIPLEFWFCRNPGLSLPLIALQYHEVKINIEFRDKASCFWASDYTSAGIVMPSLNGASLFVDYFFLDSDERRRFAQSAHEYLIDQLQFTGDESIAPGASSQKIKMNFNHPVKELIWVTQRDDVVDPSKDLVTTNKGLQWFNWTDGWDLRHQVLDSFVGTGALDPNFIPANAGSSTTFVNNLLTTVVAQTQMLLNTNITGYNLAGDNPTVTAKLQLNGHDRFSQRSGVYFNVLQPWQYHENSVPVGINVFSFAIKPEDYQPSGTCNMSRIDTAQLQLTLSNAFKANSGKVKIFATNYNVLRIMSGMGGLAYAN